MDLSQRLSHALGVSAQWLLNLKGSILKTGWGGCLEGDDMMCCIGFWHSVAMVGWIVLPVIKQNKRGR